ncbi:hypothetical protein RRG08_051832 [Elysia crispata]|uniref:Uncharacterized protein n=1 Tax=Elysia crispata TaxID=231223 RepID=A0AAE1DDB0_9GAST|nr:hypothetical protein RRG08_051832 [Elysia crispata]
MVVCGSQWLSEMANTRPTIKRHPLDLSKQAKPIILAVGSATQTTSPDHLLPLGGSNYSMIQFGKDG